MQKKRRIRDTFSYIGARSIAAALVVLLITAGIAAFVGVRVSATERSALRLRGELNAKESAREYDRCLLTRVNIIALTGEVTDSMLASGESNASIRQYMKDRTANIKNTLDPTTTGLYGWINGEYLDGAGWVPEEGFVATERPWYVQAAAAGEGITFIEPYLDLQTNEVMMTVSQLLSDGVSVLAMDVSLAPIQEIIAKIASSTEGSQAIVLDRSGIVVAHSDESQLGRNYLKEEGTLGSLTAKKILEEGQMSFEIRHAEGNYSVYVDRLEGGWYSVSMINADTWYRPLRQSMIIFGAILALIVLFLAFVFVHLNQKNLALEKLNTRITQEEQRGQELKALSETDRMTGLLDRVTGEHGVEELLAAGNSGMFIEVDVDNFKTINDTLGHQTGDRVIRTVAEALRKNFRNNDIVMRLGGDEFCAFAVGIDNKELGKSLIRRLFALLDNSRIPELPEGKVCLSVGAVITGGEKENTFEGLYAAADRAMYTSKKTAGNSLTFAGE